MAGIADADRVAQFAARVGADVRALVGGVTTGSVAFSASNTRPTADPAVLVIFTGLAPGDNAVAGDLWLNEGLLEVQAGPDLTVLFADDFTGPLTEKWRVDGDGITAAGGQLTISTSGVVGSHYPTVESLVKYKLTGAAFTTDMAQTLPRSAAGNYETQIEAGLDYDNHCGLILSRWNFTGYVTTAGTRTEYQLGAYDAVADRWWRVREAGGAIYFETSANGTVWTERGTGPRPWSSESCYLIVKCGYWGTAPPAESILVNEAKLTLNA